MDEQKKVIERDIENFKNGVEKIKASFNELKLKLILDESLDLNVTDAVKKLDTELRELVDKADKLIADMDAFKLSFDNADFSLTPSEIKKTIKSLKDRLKGIKQHQIDNYNARVYATNKMVDELKKRNLDSVDLDVVVMIQSLENMSLCDVNISSWTDFRYVEQLDYNKLVATNKSITDAMEKLNVSVNNSLEGDALWIEHYIDELDKLINDSMSRGDALTAKDRLSNIANRIVGFNVKLNNNKENIAPEEFNKYFDRLNDAQMDLAQLNEKFNNVIKNDKTSDFDDLKEKLTILEREVVSYSSLVESLSGNINPAAVAALNTEIVTYGARLESIKKDVEAAYKDGKLDENQYNQLNKMVEDVEKILDDTKTKLKEPDMIKEVDVYSYLNGEIDGLEAAVAALETQIESLEKPIKDKETRKNIDKEIARLEKEVKDLEKSLEKHKDDDPEKYQATKERLDKINERLNKVGKNYRKKCPLLVRTVKSAKNFYKKHKKICLIIAGLAAIALINATVGPILIPAIMHGNIMIGASTPALAGFTNFVNNILGGIINAKQVSGVWLLSNGVCINPSGAATSLLKGLAISGIGNTALLAPMIAGVVVAVKKLMEKMKVNDLKEKLKADKEKLKEKASKFKKKKEGKPKTKTADRKATEEFAKLIKDFRKSGKTLDEYCVEKGLSEDDKKFMQWFLDESDKKKEELENDARKGRK